MSSDTPRVDAAIEYFGVGGTGAIKSAFARQLERELAALRAERDRLAQALRIIAGLEQCIDNTLGNVEIARRALGEE